MGGLTGIFKEAAERGITPPSESTCKKYGLTQAKWLGILKRQGWECSICHKTNARWNTDHEHVPGWSRMSAAKRAIYVRGVICWRCNRHLLPADMTSHRASNIVKYLDEYEARKRKALS